MITREQLISFVNKQKVAFIGSVDNGGYPNMKAMLLPRKIDGDDFYFSTNTSSMHVSQYNDNDKACVYFYNKGRFRYEAFMLTGTMCVLVDPDLKKEIWRPGDEFFYKKGVTDTDYCVLKFSALSGRRYCDFISESFLFSDI